MYLIRSVRILLFWNSWHTIGTQNRVRICNYSDTLRESILSSFLNNLSLISLFKLTAVKVYFAVAICGNFCSLRNCDLLILITLIVAVCATVVFAKGD